MGKNIFSELQRENNIKDEMNNIIEIWNKIGKWIVKEITKNLKEKKIIDENFILTISPDFSETESWEINLSSIKKISSKKEEVEKETIEKISGKLFLRQDNIPIGPSFSFSVCRANSNLFIDIGKIKEIIKHRKTFLKESNLNIFGPELSSKLSNFSKNLTIKESVRKEITEALKYLQFPEEERNAMVLSAIQNDSFRESMSAEEMLSLILRQK